MRIAVRFKDDVAILSLSGKFLAGGDGPFLRQKVKDLIDAGTRKLIFDFEGVPYIDSTGLGFLAGARVSTHNVDARLVLANVNPHVRKILNDVNLSQFFVMAADEAAALSLVHQPPPAGTVSESQPREEKNKSQSNPAPQG